MRLLLDTHIALWWLNDPHKLTDQSLAAFADEPNELLLSAASVWEAAIKEALGGLRIPTPFLEAAESTGLIEVPIRARHAVKAASLPPFHRDPFDRMLVAQALLEGLVLVTRDPLVRQYDVATMLA